MKAKSIAQALSLCVAIALTAFASGCQYILPKEEAPLPPPLVQPKDIQYSTVSVQKGNVVDSVQGTARVESVKMVDMYFTQGGGRLKSLNVKVGDSVKKGDAIVQLDNGDIDYQIQVAQLKYKEQLNSYNANKKSMRKTDRENAQIELQIAQMGIDELEKQKVDSTLVSPIDGSVVFVTAANLGSPVDAYTTLVRIADPSVRMLEFKDTSGSGNFQVGMNVLVTMDTDGSTADGQIVSAPFDRSQFDTQDLAEIVFIQVPDDFLARTHIGDQAKIVLVRSERDNVLWLPHNAVLSYQQRRYVDVLDSNGVKVEKDVQVGLETATQSEILSGLAESDKVIVR